MGTCANCCSCNRNDNVDEANEDYFETEKNFPMLPPKLYQKCSKQSKVSKITEKNFQSDIKKIPEFLSDDEIDFSEACTYR